MTQPLSIEQQKEALLQSPSKVLASYVVAYRILGYNQQISIFCMQELANRRGNGEDFDFESFIEEQCKKMPKPSPIDMKKISGFYNLKNISDMVSGIKNIKGK